jgi:hypothetical protein
VLQQQQLGGTIALAKAHCSRVFEFCAREASQILGGASYTRGGVGEKVERLYREVRAYAIPGGSEEVSVCLFFLFSFFFFVMLFSCSRGADALDSRPSSRSCSTWEFAKTSRRPSCKRGSRGMK